MKIICDWENCSEIGSYKAPIERDNSRKFRLLCLEHIKIFNKKWNYSTKSFSSSENYFNILWSNALEDKFNIFKSSGFREFKKTKLSNTDKDALDIMELKHDTKWDEIQKKFKTLVKKYHPDKNNGNKKFEDRLKKITLAYSQLKMTLGKK